MLGSWLRRRTVAPTAVTKYQRAPRVVAALEPTKTVISDGSQFFTLNQSSTRIWQLLEKPRTRDELVEVVADEYDAPKALVQRDTEQLLAELARLKLISLLG